MARRAPDETQVEELPDGTVLFSRLPPSLDADRLRREMRCHPGSRDEARFEAMLACAAEHARPKALYRICPIQSRDGNDCTIQGITFSGPLLRRQLARAHRVFPFLVTCGRELDAFAPAPGDVLENYYWGRICMAIMRRAHNTMRRDLQHRLQVPRTAHLAPGSGDAWLWPLEQLRLIFELLGDKPGAIGVEIKPTCVMIPFKSLCGFHYASETEFQTCRACHLEACPDRLAPLDHALWEELRRNCRA